ncbi:hypothetical protein [Motilimonas pumila]|uniref:Outer membrane protein beta-barrel domain-containing protein n=1 Tax=Motilimonas pumila TaxID=2303987 RepID=A0A418YDD0_9GAMM|nr:hypothetical protein [Motilimonas pumila]RJG42546.1 hypothetical protein D1Z90_12850 [Motilimonas pumila]
MKAIISLFLVVVSGQAMADLPSVVKQVPEHQVSTQGYLDQNYWLDLPHATYQTLSQAFDDIYNKTFLSPQATPSAFKDSNLYDIVALPLFSAPTHGVQFEVFGQLYDESNAGYTNLNRDQAMYEFINNNQQISQSKEDLAVGFGLSFDMTDTVNLKTLYSTGQIPGYGSSQMSVGIEIAY